VPPVQNDVSDLSKAFFILQML